MLYSYSVFMPSGEITIDAHVLGREIHVHSYGDFGGHRIDVMTKFTKGTEDKVTKINLSNSYGTLTPKSWEAKIAGLQKNNGKAIDLTGGEHVPSVQVITSR